LKLTLIFNPASHGLSKVFRDYQEEALRFIWERNARVRMRKAE
jgi:hypothetical protein